MDISVNFAMGSPLITDLNLIIKSSRKQLVGHIIVDDNNQFLCCTTFEREEGFRLVAIDLETNRINELDFDINIYCPYKFENNEFIVITTQDKIDLTKDFKRYKLPERRNRT